jgi:hypothetical protein
MENTSFWTLRCHTKSLPTYILILRNEYVLMTANPSPTGNLFNSFWATEAISRALPVYKHSVHFSTNAENGLESSISSKPHEDSLFFLKPIWNTEIYILDSTIFLKTPLRNFFLSTLTMLCTNCPESGPAWVCYLKLPKKSTNFSYNIGVTVFHFNKQVLNRH